MRPAALVLAAIGIVAALAAGVAHGRPTPAPARRHGRNDPPAASAFSAYSTEPTWTADRNRKMYDTGVALADIDGDGFPDIVVANGNDKSPQTLDVYLNHPDRAGTARFGENQDPDWKTDERAYFNHVAAGDIDGDGCVDVAVSVPFSSLKPQTGEAELGAVRVYMNRGRKHPGEPCGGLPKDPSYVSEDGLLTISCALADVDGDGDLDLVAAVAAEGKGVVKLKAMEETSAGPRPAVSFRRRQPPAPEESAPPPLPGYTRIFLNQGGKLEKTATWKTEEPSAAADVTFADFDQDGLLDLAVAAPRTAVYFGEIDPSTHRPTIARKARWEGEDEGDFSYSVSAGRLAGLPTLALATSFASLDWGPDAPTYPFFVYAPAPDGSRKKAVWRSVDKGRGSRVLLADLDRDGNADLATGRWAKNGSKFVDGERLRIYRGQGNGHLSPGASWLSKRRPVGQAIAAANLYHPAKTEKKQFQVSAKLAGRSVLTLDEMDVGRVVGVVRNGTALRPSEFASVPGASWVSLARPLAQGDVIDVEYAADDQPDLVVADWEPDGPLAVYAYRAH